MPSSVVFAALVLAWLVVLVPVVARRRQMVPRPAEADLSARVLRRTTGAPMIEEVAVATTQSSTSGSTRGRTEMSGASSRTTTAVAERPDETVEAVDAELDLESYDSYESDPHGDREPASRERVLPRRPVEDDEDWDDDEHYAYGDSDGGVDGAGEYRDVLEDDLEDEEYDEYVAEAPADRLPRPYRPGRGGFDPDAAEAAAHARYTFRQRVALGLIAVAVLSALAALVVSSAMWWLHVATDVVLVGYLVFLRRQTRIEDQVRARRAARLSGERRALEARRRRQDEHDERMAAARADGDWIEGDWDDVAEDEDADRFDDETDEYDEYDEYDEVEEAPRWAAPRTPAPPVPADLELVDDSDEDPAFHDLDGERTHGFRRAAGA